MTSAKPNTVRTIFAWFIGISVWLFSFGAITNLLHSLGLYGTIAEYAIVVPCCMIGARAGMAIRAGKLNGGVSKKGNIQFIRWMIFFIILGFTGTFAQILLDMTFNGKLLAKAIAIGLLVNGGGVLLIIKLRLIDNDTNQNGTPANPKP